VSGDRRDAGMAIRRKVLGDEYVDESLARADDFSAPLQDLIGEYCWGAIWGRDGLPLKVRSLITLAMLAALGKPDELALHTRGALNNGCTPDEIREVLLQAAVYCGIPAGLESFRAARRVIDESA